MRAAACVATKPFAFLLKFIICRFLSTESDKWWKSVNVNVVDWYKLESMTLIGEEEGTCLLASECDWIYTENMISVAGMTMHEDDEFWFVAEFDNFWKELLHKYSLDIYLLKSKQLIYTVQKLHSRSGFSKKLSRNSLLFKKWKKLGVKVTMICTTYFQINFYQLPKILHHSEKSVSWNPIQKYNSFKKLFFLFQHQKFHQTFPHLHNQKSLIHKQFVSFMKGQYVSLSKINFYILATSIAKNVYRRKQQENLWVLKISLHCVICKQINKNDSFLIRLLFI